MSDSVCRVPGCTEKAVKYEHHGLCSEHRDKLSALPTGLRDGSDKMRPSALPPGLRSSFDPMTPRYLDISGWK